MAFHLSNFGAFAGGLKADMNGYVPEATDGPFALAWDHGSERTHDAAGELTEYGEWWAEEGYPDLLADNIDATEAAQARLHEWQAENV